MGSIESSFAILVLFAGHCFVMITDLSNGTQKDMYRSTTGRGTKTKLERERSLEVTSMRTITLEEHYASPGFLAGPGRAFVERAGKAGNRLARILDQLQELDAARIEAMARPASTCRCFY
jgi:hypothetical protein